MFPVHNRNLFIFYCLKYIHYFPDNFIKTVLEISTLLLQLFPYPPPSLFMSCSVLISQPIKTNWFCQILLSVWSSTGTWSTGNKWQESFNWRSLGHWWSQGVCRQSSVGKAAKLPIYLHAFFSALPSNVLYSFSSGPTLHLVLSPHHLENGATWQTHTDLRAVHRCLELISISWVATVMSLAWINLDQQPHNTSHEHLI